MPLGNILKAGKKMYDEGKKGMAAEEPDFIPSVGKRNSMPTTSTRVSARETVAAARPAATTPAPKRRADPNDMGRTMESMGMGAGKAAKTLNQRKKMLEDY